MKQKIMLFLAGVFFLVAIFMGYQYMTYNHKLQVEQKTQTEKIAKAQKKFVKVKKKQDKNKSEVKDPQIKSINWTQLAQTNKHIIGWISIPGTTIDYPLMQGQDNSFYLTHDYTDNESGFGSIFMDYSQPSDFSSKNTFIYGHNIPADPNDVFTPLNKFYDSSFLKSHQTVYFYTPKAIYKGTIFAIHADSGVEYAHSMNFSSTKAYRKYINYMIDRSTVKTNMKAKNVAKMVTLWTCADKTTTDNNGREVSAHKARTLVSVSIKQIQ